MRLFSETVRKLVLFVERKTSKCSYYNYNRWSCSNELATKGKLAMPILAVMSDIRLSFSLQRHIIQIVCRYLLFTLNLCVANGAFKRTKYTHWNDAYSVLRFHFWLQIQSIPITNTQPHQTLSLTLICSFARSLAYSQQKQLKQRQQCHNLSPNVFLLSLYMCHCFMWQGSKVRSRQNATIEPNAR